MMITQHTNSHLHSCYFGSNLKIIDALQMIEILTTQVQVIMLILN